MHMRWELQGNRSLFYPVVQKRLKDEFQKLINDQVTPWVFMTTSAGLKLKKFDGKQINYGGIEFSGTPEQLFWGGYIEPFLEHISFSVIEEAVEKCKNHKTELQPVLNDVQELLTLGIRNVYAQMADVDRRLRGKGYPEKVPSKNTDAYVKRMEAFVSRRIESELKLWKFKPWFTRIEHFYEGNKGLVWIVGSLISILAIVVSIIKVFFA